MKKKQKKKHMDFITERNHSKMRFRFYPRASHMHGFGDEPPKDLDSVYKVYYSWSIFKAERTDSGEWGEYAVVFPMRWDECSCIADELPAALRSVLDCRNEEVTAQSFGQPGSDWRIWCVRGTEVINEDLDEVSVPEEDLFTFEIFDSWTNKGYRFELKRKEAERFCEYLDSINNHMLENGEPI